jgi:hypothetical protein
MIRIAADFDRFAVSDRYAHRAGIGAIVWAYGSGELGWSVHWKSGKSEQKAADDGILLRPLCDRPSDAANSGGVECSDQRVQ